LKSFQKQVQGLAFFARSLTGESNSNGLNKEQTELRAKRTMASQQEAFAFFNSHLIYSLFSTDNSSTAIQ
jgi:hypothetical protein